MTNKFIPSSSQSSANVKRWHPMPNSNKFEQPAKSYRWIDESILTSILVALGTLVGFIIGLNFPV